ncbi:hypothetical protein BCAR13_270002 [Paraburkholderia caribensis]|nr:hypothetical protein BCAR13_270002 [Paraburkholderia caribensis]
MSARWLSSPGSRCVITSAAKPGSCGSAVTIVRSSFRLPADPASTTTRNNSDDPMVALLLFLIDEVGAV